MSNMSARAINKTANVLHMDSVIFVMLTLLICASAFFGGYFSIVDLVFECLPFLVLMAFLEWVVRGLATQRKIYWLIALGCMAGHILFGMGLSSGFSSGLLVLPAMGALGKLLGVYFLVSAVWGIWGLFSSQSLKVFFRKSRTLEDKF